jgi:hypothetical protein
MTRRDMVIGRAVKAMKGHNRREALRLIAEAQRLSGASQRRQEPSESQMRGKGRLDNLEPSEGRYGRDYRLNPFDGDGGYDGDEDER